MVSTMNKILPSMLDVRNEKFTLSLKTEVDLNCMYKHKLANIMLKINELVIYLLITIYEFKTLRYPLRKIRKSINLRREKLTRIHAYAINQYVKRSFRRGFALRDIGAIYLLTF